MQFLSMQKKTRLNKRQPKRSIQVLCHGPFSIAYQLQS